jgi:hypothetical protein
MFKSASIKQKITNQNQILQNKIGWDVVKAK